VKENHKENWLAAIAFGLMVFGTTVVEWIL